MIQRRTLIALIISCLAVYLLFAPTQLRPRFKESDVLETQPLINDEGQIEIPAAQLIEEPAINIDVNITAPQMKRRPTLHILYPPQELVWYAQSCNSRCLKPGHFEEAAAAGAMGKDRSSFDQTMPYHLRYTGQFASADIFHERVQDLIRDQPEAVSVEEADFVLVHVEVATTLHQCSNCLGKDRSKAEAAQFRRQSAAMNAWLEETFRSLRGRRSYPSVFFVMSRVGEAYRRDLMSPDITALFGQDVVALGIEAAARPANEFQFEQIPYPTQFHLNPSSLDESGLSGAEWQTSRRRKTLLSLMAGRIQVMSRAGTNLRQKLSDDLSISASEAPDQVYFVDKIDKWNNMYRQMARSVFCVQPTGDSPTRRGFYDSILLGCIPVIFSNTAYKSFGSPAIELNDLAIYIPHEDYLQEDSEDLLSRLQAVPQDVITEKQRLIAEAAPAVQYSLLSAKEQDRLDDAFSRSIRKLFRAGGFDFP